MKKIKALLTLHGVKEGGDTRGRVEGENGEGLPGQVMEVHHFLLRWGSRRWDSGGVNPAVAEGASTEGNQQKKLS